MLGGEIKVVLSLDNNQFVVQTQKAGVTIQELQRIIDKTSRSTEALEHHFTGAMGKFRSVIQVASMLRYAMHDVHDVFMALPGAILKSSGDMEKMSKLMQGMSRETTKAAREAEALSNVKFVFNMAQRAPFDVKTLTDAFVKFKSAGLDPTDGSMRALVDSVARFGGTSDTMHRASIAIQQMAGKGVISMEELRQQLGEAVPNAINMMAQGAGMSMQKFAKLVSTGTVEASTALRNMFLVMRFENDGAAEAMMDSWTGMLSLLSTKFELFKIEAGKNDFFKEAKNQLADLIGSFDSGGAKRFANDIGSGLADLVRSLRDLIDLMVQWSDTITLAGKAFLAYFALTKVTSLAASTKEALKGQVDKYKEDVKAKQDALTNKQTLIANEIAAEQHSFTAQQAAIDKKIAADQKAFSAANESQIKTAERERAALAKQLTSQIASDVKSAEHQRATLAKRLAEHNEHYKSLNTLQQEFLGRQMAAEMAAEAAMRQKKAGSAATARAYYAEAQRLGGNAAVNASAIAAINAEVAAIKAKDEALLRTIQTARLYSTEEQRVGKNAGAIAAISAEAAAIKAREDALLKSIQAARGVTAANNYQAESFATLVRHTQNMVDLNGRHSEAALRAAAGVGALSKAMSGAKVVFEAMGGWVGIAIAALATLGQKLWEYMDRWNEFKKIVDRTKSGISSQDDLRGAEARAEEIKKKIADREKELRGMGNRDERPIGSDAFGNTLTETRAEVMKDLAAMRSELDGIQNTAREQTKLLSEDRVRIEVSQFERTYRRGTEAKVDALRNESAELAKVEAEERKAAQGKGGRESELEEISKRYAEKRNALVKAREGFLLDYANGKKAELQAILSMEKNADKRIALQKELSFVNEQIEQAATALNQSDALGKSPTAKKDPKPKLKEAPIVRMAERLEAEVAAARAKLAATLADARNINSLREQVMFEALGDMAEGKFDTMVEGKDGEKVPNRMGGTEARKNYVKELSDYLAKGNTDLKAFVNSLDQLKDKTQFLEVFQAMVDKRQLTDAEAALRSIKQVGVDTTDELNRSTLEFVNDGLVKENTYLDETQKRLNKLALTVTQNTEGYAEFIRLRDKSLSDAGQVDINKMGTEASKATREADLYAKKAILSQSELKRFEHQEELKRIEKIQERQEAATWESLTTGVISSQQFQDRMTEIASHGDALRAASVKRLNADLMTPIEKIAIAWRDTTTAMQQATGDWADDFMKRFTEMIAGGSFKWQEFVSNMAKDLLSMSLKKNFGDMVTSAFGSFGAKASEMLGLGSGAATNAAQTTAVSTAMTTMTTATTTAMGSIASEMTMALTTLGTNASMSFGEMVASIGTAMMEMVTVVTTAMTEMAAAAGAGSFFANGGIMTSAGSLPLKMYANGGVANSPQMAIFGEGATPEAYVPLPDGRSIPVTMSGGSSTTTTSNGVIINIVVNKDGTQSTSATGDDGKAWQAVAQKVRAVVMDEMVNQQRPGGLLYNR